MGNKHRTANNDESTSNEQQSTPSTLTNSQANLLQRLFSRGLHPDVGLLPYQMPRMKVDAPPKAKQSKKTIRMKSICHMDKKTFTLKHIKDNKYNVTFEYSTTLDVFCSIYFFVTETTNKYNCTLKMEELHERSIMNYIPQMDQVNDDDDAKEEHKHDDMPRYGTPMGTTYLLPKGYNLTFEQNDKDYMDLNAVNYRFFQSNASLGYYPLMVVLSLQKPRETLLCISDMTPQRNKRAQPLEAMLQEDQQKIAQDHAMAIQNNVEYVTKSINYGKLVLGSDNLYRTEIESQKTQVKNRAFESQDIYGLDRAKDPYSGEENLCVICITMPKDTALCPCRHLCLCASCAKQLLQRSNKCPVCRAYVSETIKISNNRSNPLLAD